MWHLGTCFNGGCGSAGSTVGLKDLRHISTLNDCMILRFHMTYPCLTISQESFHCVLMGWVSEAVGPVVRGMEHRGEHREARAASDAACATPQLFWPGFPSPHSMAGLCCIPGAVRAKPLWVSEMLWRYTTTKSCAYSQVHRAPLKPFFSLQANVSYSVGSVWYIYWLALLF